MTDKFFEPIAKIFSGGVVSPSEGVRWIFIIFNIKIHQNPSKSMAY